MEEKKDEQTGPAMEPVKVMLADDDKDDQEIFHEAVKVGNIPAEITTADNGQELMDNLKDETIPNPDIIFLDINMPVKDGKECLQEIKKDENLKDIPTVMFTSSKSPKDIDDTYKGGANLYVSKPDSFNIIVVLLKKIILNFRSFIFRPHKKDFVVDEKNIADRTEQ